MRLFLVLLFVTRAASGDVLAEAERILTEARETSYSHKTHIDERERSYDVDCSGFVAYLLQRAAPEARKELDARRPLAANFVDHLAALPLGGKRGHWLRVANAVELEPGDLIAWRKPADSESTDTGHVMVVAGHAVMVGGEIHVPVIDSSALRHGSGDERAAGAATGVGTGIVVLLLDTLGRPMAFRWAPGRGFHIHETEIVLGRAL